MAKKMPPWLDKADKVKPAAKPKGKAEAKAKKKAKC